MAALFVALLATGIALPHASDLRRVPAGTAVLVWASSLGLRAMAGLFLATYVIFLLPGTELFQAVTHWCWHAVLPLLTTHLGFNGHNVGDAVVLLPIVVSAISLASFGVGLARATAGVRRLIRRHAVGAGPEGAVVLADDSVVLAAAGLGHPRVMVSTGALASLDDGELSAGLAHERGHIERRHRWVLLYAEICRGLGCVLPGSRTAVRQLAFHLERDADAWALRRHDALDLAGAICKAALSTRSGAAFHALSGDTGTRERVEDLVHGQQTVEGVRLALVRTAGLAAAVLLLALFAALPGTVASAATSASANALPEHCVS